MDDTPSSRCHNLAAENQHGDVDPHGEIVDELTRRLRQAVAWTDGTLAADEHVELVRRTLVERGIAR